MRLLIDILHPAHVHFFKHLYWRMLERGHQVRFTARRKDCATDLLDRLDIPYTCISDSTRGAGRQLWELASRTARFVRLARRFRADALAGIMGPTIALAGKILRRPAYVFYDTEFARATNRFVYPLAAKVITPDCYTQPVRGNHLSYPGYHELAYLHPSRFEPSAEVVRAAGVDPQAPYAVVRFVGWWATHDRGERGLSTGQKIELVRALERHCPVVLTSEANAPPEIADRVYQGPVHQIHHLLAFARLYYGESATMASEAAVLGAPAIYIATTGRGYTDDQARYNLVYNFTDRQFPASLQQAEQLLADGPQTAARAAAGRRQLLADKIDVTQYMLDLFEQDFSAPTHTTKTATIASVR